MESIESSPSPCDQPPLTPGRLAQLACILEVMAPKPGNVQRHRDLPGLHVLDFLASALAIAEPLDRAGETESEWPSNVPSRRRVEWSRRIPTWGLSCCWPPWRPSRPA